MTITFYLDIYNGKYKIKGTDSFHNEFNDVLSYGPTEFKTIKILKGTQLILDVNTNENHPFLIVKNSTNPNRIQNDNNSYTTGITYPSENYLTGKGLKIGKIIWNTANSELGTYYGICINHEQMYFIIELITSPQTEESQTQLTSSEELPIHESQTEGSHTEESQTEESQSEQQKTQYSDKLIYSYSTNEIINYDSNLSANSNLKEYIKYMQNEVNSFYYLTINNNIFKNAFFKSYTFKEIPNIIYNKPILISNNIHINTYSNIPIIINLYEYFKSPINDYNLTFSNISNINFEVHRINNSNLFIFQNSNLIIHPDYRNTRYTLGIISKYNNIQSEILNFTINENNIPVININDYNLTFSNISNINIDDYYNYKHKDNIIYSNLSYNIHNYNFDEDTGILKYNFDYIKINEQIRILIKDKYYLNSNIITFTFHNKNPLYINQSNVIIQQQYIEIHKNNININLNNYVSNIFNDDIINYNLISSTSQFNNCNLNYSNLIVNTDFRNTSYQFIINAFINSYPNVSNNLTIIINELIKPTPILFNYNSNITSDFINLTNYFSNIFQDNILTFHIQDNNNNFTINNHSNLNVINKFNYHKTTIQIDVKASNNSYNTSNNFTFYYQQQPVINKITIPNFLNSIDYKTIDLNDYFSNNNGNSNIYNIKVVSISNIINYYQKNNENFHQLNSNFLSLTPYFRTNLYNITITAHDNDFKYYIYSNTFNYSEKPLNNLIINNNCNIQLTKNYKIKNDYYQYIDLDKYIINNNNINFKYYFDTIDYNNDYNIINNNIKIIESNINDSNICEIDDNKLEFYHNNRPFLYTLYIYASNIEYNFRSSNLILNIDEEQELFKIKIINDIYYNENLNEQNDNFKIKINLKDYIKYKNDEDIKYNITSPDIDNNSFYKLNENSHVLNIIPDFRNKNYKVIIQIYDEDYPNEINATTFFYVNESYYKFYPNQSIYYINQDYDDNTLNLYNTFFNNKYYDSNEIHYNLEIDNSFKDNYIILTFKNNQLFLNTDEVFNIGYINFNYKIINTTDLKIYNKFYNIELEYNYIDNYITFKPNYFGTYYYNDNTFKINKYNQNIFYNNNKNNLIINQIKSPFFPIKLTISCKDNIYFNNILLKDLIIYKVYLRYFYHIFNESHKNINLKEDFIEYYNIDTQNQLKFSLNKYINNVTVSDDNLNIIQSFKGNEYEITIDIYNNLYKISQNIYKITEPKPLSINKYINKKYYVNTLQPEINLNKYIIKNDLFNYDCNLKYKYNKIESDNSIFKYDNKFIYNQINNEIIYLYYENYNNDLQMVELTLYFKEKIIDLDFFSINNNFKIIKNYNNLENCNIDFIFKDFIKTDSYDNIILSNLNNIDNEFYELHQSHIFSNILYKPFFRNINKTLKFNVINTSDKNELINTIRFTLKFNETHIYKLPNSNILFNLNYIQCNLNLNDYIDKNDYIINKYSQFSFSNIKFQDNTSNYDIRNTFNTNLKYYNFDSNTNIININPEFRNIKYQLNFLIYLDCYTSNINDYYSNNIIFNINEDTIPNIKNNENYIEIISRKETINCNLTNYYIYPFLDFLIYTCNIQNNSNLDINIINSNLIINTNYRNTNYNINIIAIDNNFQNSNTNLNFNIVEKPTLEFITSNSKTISLNNSQYIFYFSNLFQKDTFLENCNFILDFKETTLSNIYQTGNYNNQYFYSSNNEYLIIYPEFRNTQYQLKFEIYLDNFHESYHKHDFTFIIDETQINNIKIKHDNIIRYNLSNQTINENLKNYYEYPYLNFLTYDCNIEINIYEINNCNLNLDINIISSNLIINTDFRNLTYNITINSFENNIYSGYKSNSNLIFEITELPPFILNQSNLEFYNLSNIPKIIDLNKYITNYTNSNLQNYIYYPNFRGLTSKIQHILKIDNYNYYQKSINILITEIPSFTIINPNIEITNLSNINKIINLNQYINNNTSSNIIASLKSNQYHDTFSYSNNELTLKPLFRNIQYNLEFDIYIENYENQSNIITFDITELNTNIEFKYDSNIDVIIDSNIKTKQYNLHNFYNYDYKENLIFDITFENISNVDNDFNYNVNILNNSNLIIEYHYNFEYKIIIRASDDIYKNYDSNLIFIVEEIFNDQPYKITTIIDQENIFNNNDIDDYILNHNDINPLRYLKTWHGTASSTQFTEDKSLKIINLKFNNENWYNCNLEIKDIGLFIKDTYTNLNNNTVCIGDYYEYTKDSDYYYTNFEFSRSQDTYTYSKDNNNIFETALNQDSDDYPNIINGFYTYPPENIDFFMIINNHKLFDHNSNIIQGYYIIKPEIVTIGHNVTLYNKINDDITLYEYDLNINEITTNQELTIDCDIEKKEIKIKLNNNIINKDFNIYKRNRIDDRFKSFRDPHDNGNRENINLTDNRYSNIIININDIPFNDIFYCYDFKRKITSNFDGKQRKIKEQRFQYNTNIEYTLFNDKIKLGDIDIDIIDKYDLYFDVIYEYSFKIFNVISGFELNIQKQKYIPYGHPIDFKCEIDNIEPIIRFKWNHNPRNLYNIDNEINNIYEIKSDQHSIKITNLNKFTYYFNNFISDLNNKNEIYDYYNLYYNDDLQISFKLNYNNKINLYGEDGNILGPTYGNVNFIKIYEKTITIPKYFLSEDILDFEITHNIKKLNENNGTYTDYIRIKIKNYKFNNDDIDYQDINNNLYFINNNRVDLETLISDTIIDAKSDIYTSTSLTSLTSLTSDNHVYINVTNFRNQTINLKIVKYKIVGNKYIKFSNFKTENININNIPRDYLYPPQITNFNANTNNKNNYIKLTWDPPRSIWINRLKLYQIKINNEIHYHCNLEQSNINSAQSFTLIENYYSFKLLDEFDKDTIEYKIDYVYLRDNNIYLFKLIAYHSDYFNINDSNLYSYAINTNSNQFISIKTLEPRKAPCPSYINSNIIDKNNINLSWTDMNNLNIWNKTYSIDDPFKYNIIRKNNETISHIYYEHDTNSLNDINLCPNTEFKYEIYTLTNMNYSNNNDINYQQSDNCNIISLSTLKPVIDENNYIEIMPSLDIEYSDNSNILKWKLPNISNIDININNRYNVQVENYYNQYYSNILLYNYSNLNNNYNIDIPNLDDKFKPTWREYTNKIINSNILTSYWRENIIREIDNIVIKWREDILFESNLINVIYNIRDNQYDGFIANIANGYIHIDIPELNIIKTIERFRIKWWEYYNRWEEVPTTTTHFRLNIDYLNTCNIFNDNDIIAILQENTIDPVGYVCLDSLKWKDISNLTGNSVQFICPDFADGHINHENSIYFERWDSETSNIEVLEIESYQKKDAEGNIINHILYDDHILIEELSSYQYHNIKLKQSRDFSYNPIYINFEINVTSTLANTTIYILQKYDNYDTEYLDKYKIESDSGDNEYIGSFICSRRIPLRSNHKGITDINNIYFELYDSDENKLETLNIDIDIINKINSNEYTYTLSRQTGYSPTNITFQNHFDIYQNDIIAAIQFKNNNADFNNILCLDSYKIGHDKSLTISLNIPYINEIFYIEDQPIYIVLYQSNVIQLLQHIDINIDIKDQSINIHKFNEYSYDPKIFDISTNTIFINDDIISVIQINNDRCLDIYKWNDTDSYKKLICSSKLPYDFNDYGKNSDVNTELYFLLYRNNQIFNLIPNNIITLNSYSNINLQVNHNYYKYIKFNINNISLINPQNNDIISILQHKESLECVGKYIYNHQDNSNEIICISSDNKISNFGINTNIEQYNLYYEIYRSNLNIIERLDFNIDNLVINEYINNSNIFISNLDKTFKLYNNGKIYETLYESNININDNIYSYDISSLNTSDNFISITWYYTMNGFEDESSPLLF